VNIQTNPKRPREMFHRAPRRLRVGDLQTSLEISDYPETPRSPDMD